jgi:voltage-gated potassium channel
MPLWRQHWSPVRVPCSLLRDGTTHPIPIVLNPANFADVLLAGPDPLRAYRVVSTDLAAADGQVVLHERALTATEVGIALSEIRAGLGHRIYRAIEALESASRRHSGSNRGISSSRPYGVVRPNPPPTDTVCYE